MMRLSKGNKILVGLATAWTVIYPLLFIGLVLVSMAGTWFGSASGTPEGEAPDMAWLFTGLVLPLHCLTILIQLGLCVFYLVHLLKNEGMSDTVRIILGIGIFAIPYIAIPIYYYTFLWRDEPPAWAVRGS